MSSIDINLGPAGNFNIYVLNVHYQLNGICGGRASVGNAYYNDFQIGSQLSRSLYRGDLLIQGEANISSGKNINGVTKIRELEGVISYSMIDAQGKTNIYEDSTISVSEYENYYIEISKIISEYRTVGTYYIYGNNDSLNLAGVKGKAIFSFNGDNIYGKGKSLQQFIMLNFNNVSDANVIIINISGKNLQMNTLMMSINWGSITESYKKKILFNFYEAETLNINNTTVEGTILAPLATVTFNNSTVNGTVIAKNINGRNNSNYYNYLFTGVLPSVQLNTNLSFKKIADKQVVTLGEDISYTIVITNEGDRDLVNFKVKDRIDKNSIYIRSSLILYVIDENTKEVLPEYSTMDLVRDTDLAYAIVPECARYPYVSGVNRDISVYINKKLKAKNTIVIKITCKIGGEYVGNEGKNYGLNNQDNINVLNAKNIINKITVGYDGLIKQELADFDNVEDIDKIESSMSILKYSKIYSSKSIFKFNEVSYDEYGKNLSKGDKICYLITLKNYGELEANISSFKDLIQEGLSVRDGNGNYSDDCNILSKEVLTAITIKCYDNNLGSTGYITGKNNDIGEEVIEGYLCDNDEVAEKAREKINDDGSTLGILVKDKYIEILNLKVPGRKYDDFIKREINYEYGMAQSDTVNDNIIGIVEIRIYYTI